MSRSMQKILTEFVFSEDGKKSRTTVTEKSIGGTVVKYFVNEFWTSRQRQANSLHEVSYRACFKPQLPRFFIERLTREGDVVYDPFSGRGTTVLEAALHRRRIIANDINPLSVMLSRPRLFLPAPEEIEQRLSTITWNRPMKADISLSMFFHPRTLREILNLRKYLSLRKKRGTEDNVDRWIRMVATNRLTGHSKGFFSVYTLPPNQALSQEQQRKINKKRKQKPEYRDVARIILKKSSQLMNGVTEEQRTMLRSAGRGSRFLTCDAGNTKRIRSGSVRLTVTSPPFLDVVQYGQDNWLRCWFNDIDASDISKRITMSKTIGQWCSEMRRVFQELHRITAEAGWIAFEVGEIRKGNLMLEEYVVQLGTETGFRCEGVMINQQHFTKTANIWGVGNNSKGTNSNRIVLFRRNKRD